MSTVRRLAIVFILLVYGPIAASAQVAGATHAAAGEYQIEIDKSRALLQVKRDDTLIREYRAATGRGGKGTKRKLGDKKTPVGVYRVVDFKSDSRYHFFMQLDYPNLLDAWYGYKNELINAKEFRTITTAVKNNEVPPQDTALGGYIGIHGIGDINDEKLMIHAGQDWTAGCIALTNEEITELRQYVTLGTQIIIHE